MTIKNKLIYGFIIAALLVCFAGGFGIMMSKEIGVYFKNGEKDKAEELQAEMVQQILIGEGRDGVTACL